jgi:hypothetical protein
MQKIHTKCEALKQCRRQIETKRADQALEQSQMQQKRSIGEIRKID